MLNILFHDDWEIFGDGSGSPEKLMFEPAKKILDICDKYNVRYTFYAEIGQQLNMLNAPEIKWRRYADKWEQILKDAVSRKHDVQLHFHPQWIGGTLKKGIWNLNNSNWHSGYVDADLFIDWIHRGKEYLENLFNGINKDYKVVSFRAGTWLIQPSRTIYNALKENDIICDVTILKGRYNVFEDGSVIDFRNAFSNVSPWEVDPDNFALMKRGSGVWELPVYTEINSLLPQFYLLKNAFKPLYYHGINQKQKKNQSGRSYSPKIIQKSRAKDYYCSFGYMHHKHLLKLVNNVEKQSENQNIDHLIMLTHSKSFFSFKNFQQLLKSLNNKENIQFSTTQKYIEKKIINNR